MLAAATARLDGPEIDLTNIRVRHDIEARHMDLLLDHGLDHLDLHEITTRRRPITQAIAADAYERLGAGAIRFPSRLDGGACLAVFEERGELVDAAPPTELVDPAPEVLVAVCAAWHLALEPTPSGG